MGWARGYMGGVRAESGGEGLSPGEDVPEGQAVGEQKAEGPGGWAARGGQAVHASTFSPSETEPAS